MDRSKHYHTRQQKAILEYLVAHGEDYVTVSQIAAHLNAQGQSVGLTTVYRHLEKFAQEGLVHKIVLDGNSGAHYQYAGGQAGGFLLKCESCGNMLPMECSHMGGLYEHVLHEHGFAVNPHRTMFYGKCAQCMQQNGRKSSGSQEKSEI